MKKIINHLKENWIKYGFEIVVIMIGVLGAFTLNTWNENRINKEEEYRILLDLEKEFQKNKESADLKLNLNKNSRGAAYHLTELNSKGTLFDNLSHTDSLLSVLLSWGSFDAQVGVCNEVINSGKIALIRDQELKNKLTGWSSQLINAEEDYKARVDHWVLVMMPFMGRHFNLAHIDNYMNWSQWDKDYNTKFYKSSFHPNMNINPLEVENMLYQFKNNTDYVIISETSISAYIDQILRMIHRNLNVND